MKNNNSINLFLFVTRALNKNTQKRSEQGTKRVQRMTKHNKTFKIRFSRRGPNIYSHCCHESVKRKENGNAQHRGVDNSQKLLSGQSSKNWLKRGVLLLYCERPQITKTSLTFVFRKLEHICMDIIFGGSGHAPKPLAQTAAFLLYFFPHQWKLSNALFLVYWQYKNIFGIIMCCNAALLDSQEEKKKIDRIKDL